MNEREEPILIAHVSREDLLFILPELADKIHLLDDKALHEIASRVSDALQETHHLTMRVIALTYLRVDREEAEYSL
jgi:hypothetical protein